MLHCRFSPMDNFLSCPRDVQGRYLKNVQTMRDHLSDGGVIVEVRSFKEAKTAAQKGAHAVVITDPCDLANGILMEDIKKKIPQLLIFAKHRWGHFVEGEILDQFETVDGILEEKVLYPGALEISKFQVMKPIMSSCNTLGDVVKKISTGSSILLVEGENFSDTCLKLDQLMQDFVAADRSIEEREGLFSKLKGVDSFRPVMEALSRHFSKEKVHFPTLVICAGGGVSCPADSALLRRMGCDAVYLTNDIFQKEDPDFWGDHLYATSEAVKWHESPDLLCSLIRTRHIA